MAFEHFSPSVTSHPTGQYASNTVWDGMSYSTFSGYSPSMEYNRQSSPFPSYTSSPGTPVDVSQYGYYSSSETSTPSPGMISGSPTSPTTPMLEQVQPAPRYATSSKPTRPTSINTALAAPTKLGAKPKSTEDLTPKQLKRRLQNRVSQQAVRRRRNSPARILETRLQELDKEHSDLISHYTSNIESCIQTLSAEIKTLRELQGLLHLGTTTSGSLPAKFDAILGSGMFAGTGFGCGVVASSSNGGVVDFAGNMGMGVGMTVDQSAAYQNHIFDSTFSGDRHY